MLSTHSRRDAGSHDVARLRRNQECVLASNAATEHHCLLERLKSRNEIAGKDILPAICGPMDIAAASRGARVEYSTPPSGYYSDSRDGGCQRLGSSHSGSWIYCGYIRAYGKAIEMGI